MTDENAPTEARLPENAALETAAPETAVFAAGCFWGVEVAFRQTPGVRETEVGYAGGSTDDPTYEAVCSGRTGHAEVVRVVFDPGQVSYETLLAIFWECHDPTQRNRQGPDVGTQYRSAIFCSDGAQSSAAKASLAAQQASGRFPVPIATEIGGAAKFWPAEDYHQQYFEKMHGLRHAH